MPPIENKRRLSGRRLLRRFGLLGFFFFLAKGLLWLLLPLLLLFWGWLGF